MFSKLTISLESFWFFRQIQALGMFSLFSTFIECFLMQVHSIRVFVGDTVLGTCTKCLATATHRVAQKSVMIVHFVRSALNFTAFTIIKLGESNFTIINAIFLRWDGKVSCYWKCLWKLSHGQIFSPNRWFLGGYPMPGTKLNKMFISLLHEISWRINNEIFK